MSAGPALSLVIVCHEMARELPRTLLSLSPGYQRDCPRDLCEIIVMDNGSRHPPASSDFAHLGANIEVVRCPAPSRSPARAVNEGLARARADLIGVWIDGARLASPGLLGACLGASRLHPRPVVATLNHQLGPGWQHASAERGYSREAEDALLASVGWPADGYRLFEIATPELRDPTAPMLESNALFLPRALWDELGGYDERFTQAGGGVVNADTLSRAHALPGTQLVRVRGEGTFHQMHGGLSTSSLKRAMEVLKNGSRHYYRLRGKPLRPVREVGWIYDSQAGARVA